MKLPRSYYNWISVIGSAVAIFSLLLIFILFLISTIFDIGSSYIGLFVYIVLPGLMIIGLILIPIGMMIRSKRVKRLESPERKLPYIDLSDKRHRNAAIIFSLSTVVFLILSSIGSYEAYHYTESVEFCGTLCHSVMNPEYTAYQNSAHSNVACVECHVGPGTDWYIRSKLSGLYQVYAVMTNVYPRPIPTPLRNLRPARETCEKCHWPQKFYERKIRVQKNFIADSLSSEWDIILQLKTGPVYSALGLKEGIHWHINPKVNVEYIPGDEKRENIGWVKWTNLETGEINIYTDADNVLPDSIMKSTPHRTMDCIDCHNRPSHAYKSPPYYVDQALISNDIPKQIPGIKFAAMQVLKVPYKTTDSAMIKIDEGIRDYYKNKYPAYFATNKTLIEKAIKGIQKGYSTNTFPSMNVTYDAYPNHIGHKESNGCFRCHNGRFKSGKGRIISRDCDLCHSIIGQGNPNNMEYTTFYKSLEFKHPVDIQDAWKESDCSECHTYLYP